MSGSHLSRIRKLRRVTHAMGSGIPEHQRSRRDLLEARETSPSNLQASTTTIEPSPNRLGLSLRSNEQSGYDYGG